MPAGIATRTDHLADHLHPLPDIQVPAAQIAAQGCQVHIETVVKPFFTGLLHQADNPAKHLFSSFRMS